MISSGIAGLDEYLGGGLPSPGVVLLKGEPGTGRIIFGWQFLFGGAEAGERGIFLTLEKVPSEHRRELEFLHWSLDFLGEEVFFIDAASPRLEMPTSEGYVEPNPFDVERLSFRIHSVVRETGATRMVIESLPALISGLETSLEVARLFAMLKELGLTVLSLDSNIWREEDNLATGIVHLELEKGERGLVRRGVVRKMPSFHSLRYFYYDITSEGITLR